MACNISDIHQFTTLISTLSYIEDLPGSMGDNFTSMTTTFRIMVCFIVITFYPEAEVTLTLDHLIIGTLIVIESFHVLYVFFDVTATTTKDKI